MIEKLLMPIAVFAGFGLIGVFPHVKTSSSPTVEVQRSTKESELTALQLTVLQASVSQMREEILTLGTDLELYRQETSRPPQPVGNGFISNLPPGL